MTGWNLCKAEPFPAPFLLNACILCVSEGIYCIQNFHSSVTEKQWCFGEKHDLASNQLKMYIFNYFAGSEQSFPDVKSLSVSPIGARHFSLKTWSISWPLRMNQRYCEYTVCFLLRLVTSSSVIVFCLKSIPLLPPTPGHNVTTHPRGPLPNAAVPLSWKSHFVKFCPQLGDDEKAMRSFVKSVFRWVDAK